MKPNGHASRPIRFGVFELDLRAAELRKQGLKLKLAGQPFDVLAMLVERPGEIVTREEIEKKLWPADTFVDFDHSLNTAVNKIREALGDSADTPRYVETVPRRGYRFIAPVESLTPGPSPRGRGWFRWVGPGEGAHFGMRRIALAAGAIVVALVLLIALNVAGLRDRIVGAGLVSARGRPQGAPLPKIESIAVLPLENLSRDPEQEYFADGMTEELITNLGKIGALRVISRTTAMHYKGTKKSLPEIAKELNVDAVVEGSVLRSGNRVRVTANLLHAPADRLIWADTFERDLRDVLALQGEVARAIAGEIKVKLTPEDQTRLTAAGPIDLEAYEAFLLGRHYYNRGRWEGPGKEEYSKSIEHFQQAVQRDPNYALAYAALGESHGMLAFLEGPPTEHLQKSIEAGEKAMKLDPTLPEAHVRLGYKLFYWDWDWVRGEEEYRRAVELGPASVVAVVEYAYCLHLLCRFDEAIRMAERARQLDPLSDVANNCLALILCNARQDERAIAQCRKAIELNPENANAYGILGTVYDSEAKFDQAAASYLKWVRLAGESPEAVQALENASGDEAIRACWKKRLEALEERAKRQHISLLEWAPIYARLGEKERALECLEKAYEQHNPRLSFVKVARELDPLRSDPRFQDLVRRMNFPP
jgi:TolB-like protein/DNA-binding winged helix-turn-helix (wHTH) protein/Tfp pilus assembly protein PilF